MSGGGSVTRLLKWVRAVPVRRLWFDKERLEGVVDILVVWLV
jgi:hypothetical protein